MKGFECCGDSGPFSSLAARALFELLAVVVEETGNSQLAECQDTEKNDATGAHRAWSGVVIQ